MSRGAGFLRGAGEAAVFINAAREQVLHQSGAHPLLLGNQRLRRLDLGVDECDDRRRNASQYIWQLPKS